MDGTDGAYYAMEYADGEIRIRFAGHFDVIDWDDCTYVANKYLNGWVFSSESFQTIRDLMLAGF